MTAPTALIADDESHLRGYLKELLVSLWPELIICAEAANGLEALEALQKWQPDIAFLDIKMPGLSGLEVAEQTLNKMPHTHLVFVTAYDQFAIKAFENAALDYLLKPVTRERLQITLHRLQQKLQQTTPLPSNSHAIHELISQLNPPLAPQYLQWIKVNKQQCIKLISVEEIDYFQSADKYTSVFTQMAEWVIRTPLKKLEQKLDPEKFWRIHRSSIIRVSAVESFRKTFSGRFFLKLYGHDQSLVVSRSYAERFKTD